MGLAGPSRGGGFTKRGEIGEFGDECALQASLEGVLSPNDFEQLQSTTLSGRSSAKECQVALLFATATCRSALPECLMLFRKPCSKTFGERCALQGLPEGGGFTKRGKIGEFGDECAFYALLRGVLSPSDFEEGYHRSASRPSTGPSRTSTW